MGLDVYVMPIWRFKARDFTPPVQRLLGSDVPSYTVSPSRIVGSDRKAARGAIVRWRARRSVAQLRRAIKRQLGRPVLWNNDGDVAYGEQASDFAPLRAFAAWLDHRDQLPRFEPPSTGNYYEHPARLAGPTRPLTYPQVLNHDCFAGYFLPVDFEPIVHVESYTIAGTWTFHRAVGSSPRLMAELTAMGGEIDVVERDGLADADAIRQVRRQFEQLSEIASISCRTRLPIIFYG